MIVWIISILIIAFVETGMIISRIRSNDVCDVNVKDNNDYMEELYAKSAL